MKGKDLTLKERKDVGLLILDEIERVSKLLGVEYFLAYGTLLGAIRHNGYIPWDDDIDIWMKKRDFDLFLSKFNEVCSSDFKLISWQTDSDYPIFMPKIVYLKTTVRERWMKKTIKDLGIWVDLFCLSSIPVDVWNRDLENKIYSYELYRRVAQFRYMCFFSKLDILRMVFQNKGQHALKCILKKPSDFTTMIYSEMKDYGESSTLLPVDHLLKGSFIFEADWFSDIIYHSYEDREYPIPIGWENILELIYGDYMTPPPEKERRFRQHVAYARWVE